MASPEPVVTRLASMRTVIWDFDGVIADTEPIQMLAFEEVAAQHADTASTDFSRFVGVPEPDIWDVLRRELGIEVPGDVLADERSRRYLEHAKRALTPSAFVIDVLESPGTRSNEIVSSGSYRHIDGLLTHWHIRDRFQRVRCRDSPDGDWPGDKATALARAISEAPKPVGVVEDVNEYLAVAGSVGVDFLVGIDHSLNDIDPELVDAVVTVP